MRPAFAEAGKIRASDRRFGWTLMAPSVFILLLIGLFPLLYTLVVSFQQITMTDVDTSFAGLVNYRQLFTDQRLWESLLHTAIIFVIALPLEVLFGLLMAQLFLESMPGRQILIALIVLPTVVAPLIAGAVWRLMFDNRYGPVNEIISWFAGHPVTLLWTVNPLLVWPAIIVCEVWQWTPFMFLLLLAGLLSLPNEPFLAAKIDGAGPIRTFLSVTFPMMGAISVGAILIRLIEASKLMETVYVLTSGGPGTSTETTSYYIYIRGMRDFQIGYSASLSLTYLIVMSVALTLIAKSLIRLMVKDRT